MKPFSNFNEMNVSQFKFHKAIETLVKHFPSIKVQNTYRSDPLIVLYIQNMTTQVL